MNVPEIKPVQLTSEEAALRAQMDAELLSSSPYSGKAAHALLKSLSIRGVIPKARVRDFTEPFPRNGQIRLRLADRRTRN